MTSIPFGGLKHQLENLPEYEAYRPVEMTSIPFGGLKHSRFVAVVETLPLK
jgi:hypothetical protein